MTHNMKQDDNDNTPQLGATATQWLLLHEAVVNLLVVIQEEFRQAIHKITSKIHKVNKDDD